MSAASDIFSIFANSYYNGQKIRPDLSTDYAQAPSSSNWSFGGQSYGQTAADMPVLQEYVAPPPPPPPPPVATQLPAVAPQPVNNEWQTQANQRFDDMQKAFGGLGETLTGTFSGLNQSLSGLTDKFGSFFDTYQKNQQAAQEYKPNPYLGEMAESIKGQVNQNLNRNILPGISSGAQSVGGYGGSRQGVVEANALNDANQGLSNSLSSLYYGDYNNAMNRGMQQQSLDNSFMLGMGNLGLGNKQADNSYNLGLGNLGLNAQNSQNNFYTAQRGQDLQQYGLGAQLVNQSNQGFLNQGSGIYDAGSVYQQAPWGTIGNFNSATTPYTGYGATSTQSQSVNPWAQALGGAMLGGQIGRLF